MVNVDESRRQRAPRRQHDDFGGPCRTPTRGDKGRADHADQEPDRLDEPQVGLGAVDGLEGIDVCERPQSRGEVADPMDAGQDLRARGNRRAQERYAADGMKTAVPVAMTNLRFSRISTSKLMLTTAFLPDAFHDDGPDIRLV